MPEQRYTVQVRVPFELKERLDEVAEMLAAEGAEDVRYCSTPSGQWVPASEVIRVALNRAFPRKPTRRPKTGG